ncbi:response regulator [Pseudomonadota bacterium]
METLTLSELFVMLVEPSSTQGRIICERLEEAGVVDPSWKKEGASALAAMPEEKPDLIISAMHLPDMTGTDLVKTMRNTPELMDIPFMLVSSETDEHYLEPIRQAGAIALLPKPFETDDLKRALCATADYITPNTDLLEDINPAAIKTLVVDDSAMSRNHISKVLSNIGIEKIIQVENGKEAIDQLQADYFDLLVTDYNMPEVDGQELVRYVRNESSQSSIPIIMVTSETDQSRLTAVRQSGVSAICDKPFETNSVLSLLQQLMVDI